MGGNQFYTYRDFMEEDFPFKIEMRTSKGLNKVLHAHENFQICYVLKGACIHIVGNRVSKLTKGDIFSIPPYEEHQMEAISEKEVELIQIDFMPFLINENMRELSTMESFTDFLYIQPLLSKHHDSVPELNLSLQNAVKIEQLIYSMYEEIKSKQEGFRLSIKADLMKMLVIIGREFRTSILGTNQKETITHYRNTFQEIIHYIQENYNRELSLEEVAQKANMSPAYFSHMFKMFKGSSMVDFINGIRINQAMEELKTSDMNITEICYKVGFNNMGHFNRMFKRFTGMTPTEFKKSKGVYDCIKIKNNSVKM